MTNKPKEVVWHEHWWRGEFARADLCRAVDPDATERADGYVVLRYMIWFVDYDVATSFFDERERAEDFLCGLGYFSDEMLAESGIKRTVSDDD